MGRERTKEEQEILEKWPEMTEAERVRMNDLFRHYIFFRKTKLCGVPVVTFCTSCCGHREELPLVRRTELPEETELLNSCHHNWQYICPWCGRAVTMKDLSKAGKRKKLRQYECAMVLHGEGDALYADALFLNKDYRTEQSLTAGPEYWCCSRYRFSIGDVMQVDYQEFEKGWITHEREKLGREKKVKETFRIGSVMWYTCEMYHIMNREELTEHKVFRYCGYFGKWQEKVGCARECEFKFHDFVSYMTAYCIYPRQVEMFVRIGYYQPVADLIYCRRKNAGAIDWKEQDARKALGLNKTELKQFIALQPPIKALECRKYANGKLGARWDVEVALAFSQMWGSESDPMEALRMAGKYGLPLRKLIDRLLWWAGGATGKMLQNAFEHYRDYLDAAYHLGRCMEHSEVLWPEDLQAAHDEATDRWARVQLEEQEKAERKTVAESAGERKKKYEFELDGLQIVFPMTAAAIRREGKALKHCVGGYAERHMKDVLTILFLRRAETPNVPYVTIEMRGNQIWQIHGYHNDIDQGAKNPMTEHRGFLTEWLEWLRKGSPRNEDGTPKLPKKKNKEGSAA